MAGKLFPPSRVQRKKDQHAETAFCRAAETGSPSESIQGLRLPVLELQRTTSRSRDLVFRLLLPESSAALLSRAVAAAFFLRMIVVALVYRGLPGSSQFNGGFGWELGWVGGSIASGHGFSSPFWPATGPTAFVPPGFPYLLAGIFRIFGVYTLHAGLAILSFDSLFSALTCVPIYFVAKSVANDRIARFAAWAWVVYPFSVYYSTVVWEWSLTALLFTTCLAILLRLHAIHRTAVWAGFGLLYGLTALVNPAVLSVLPPLLLLAVWPRQRAALPWRMKSVLAVSAVFVVITPWIVHASRTMHTFVPIRDNFWLEFYAGNTGDTFESNAAWAHPASNPVEMRAFERMGEIPYLAQKRALAKDFVSHHPGWFAVATVRRFVRYWTGFWSFRGRYLRQEPLDVPNLFFCTGLTILMLRGLRRLWAFERSSALPLVVLLAIFPMTYYLTHASMDYRQPIEPVVVLLAAIGVFGLASGGAAAISEPDSEEKIEVLA